jgi:TolB-like protein/Tfp pilus assembly protein PilF
MPENPVKFCRRKPKIISVVREAGSRRQFGGFWAMSHDLSLRPVYRFDCFTLDLTRGALLAPSGMEVPLRPKSFSLLCLLVEHAGRLLDRDTIQQALWPGVCVCDDSIGQCVKDVRQALGERAQDLVKTVPKRGYILDVAVSNGSPELPLPLPSKPSIAVLAFTNMTGDPEQEFFVDGIAEDITTALSKSRSLFVISRNSGLKDKGRLVGVKDTGRGLGVRYVLQGSVRKARDQVRVTAQLADTATGGYLWAERYDHGLNDILALQDQIATSVYAAVQPALEQNERKRTASRLPESLDAWESYHRGLWHYANPQAAELDTALDFLRRAIKLDPHFALAHAALAAGYLREAAYFRPERRAENIALGRDYARRAVAIDPLDATARAVLAQALQMYGTHAESIFEASQAVRLDPNSAYACGALGAVCAWGGRPSEAIGPLRTAIRLSPFDPRMSAWVYAMARAHYWARDYESAVTASRRLCHLAPNYCQAYATLIAAFGQTGQVSAARVVMDEALERFGKRFQFFLSLPLGKIRELRSEDREHLIDGFRKAGILRTYVNRAKLKSFAAKLGH